MKPFFGPQTLAEFAREELQMSIKDCEQNVHLHKNLAKASLYKNGEFIDKEGLVMRLWKMKFLCSLRDYDINKAEEHFKKWKEASNVQLDEQLFGESKIGVLNFNTWKVTDGTDFATKTLGDIVKEDEQVMKAYMHITKILIAKGHHISTRDIVPPRN